MDNLSCISAAYDLVGEPVAASRRGKIVYMNSPAILQFAHDYTGESAGGLLPEEFINARMANFVSGVVINEKKFAVRASLIADICVYIFSPEPGSEDNNLTAMLSLLRGNLANIKLASDKLQSYCATNPAAKDYAGILNHNYYQMKRLITNLSTVSCLINNALPINSSTTDLTRLCAELVSAVDHFAGMNGQNVEFYCQNTVMASVDGELIEQMLLNLITNSLQHTPSGGLIKVTLYELGNTVNISVSDTGEGVSPAAMSVIFAKYRNYISLSDISSGLGLGLTISRGIAELHGGSLLLESPPGGGTTVHISLSKKAFSSGTVKSASSGYSRYSMDPILTQLSPILEAKEFDSKYED